MVLFLVAVECCYSQDTATARGTIKIAKVKDGEIYVKAVCKYTNYNLSDVSSGPGGFEKFQPFPVVDGYAYPFNYNSYVNDCFKNKEIDLKGKSKDTVTVEIKILENGKVYIKDKSPTMILKGRAVTYDNRTGTYEVNNLHMNCINVLKQIDKWIPGYVILPKKDKFRGEVVIKPNKKNVDVIGNVTYYFSTTPFED